MAAQLLTAREFLMGMTKIIGYAPDIHQAVQFLIQSKGAQPTLGEVKGLKQAIDNPFGKPVRSNTSVLR